MLTILVLTAVKFSFIKIQFSDIHNQPQSCQRDTLKTVQLTHLFYPQIAPEIIRIKDNFSDSFLEAVARKLDKEKKESVSLQRLYAVNPHKLPVHLV